jgi:hypothetical protein
MQLGVSKFNINLTLLLSNSRTQCLYASGFSSVSGCYDDLAEWEEPNT